MIALTTSRLILGASDADPQRWLVILGVVVFLIFILNARQRRRTRVQAFGDERRDAPSAGRRNEAAQRDMEELTVHLNELARQINAQIDARFAKLEQSIADADRRIHFLRVLLEAAKQARLLEADDPALVRLAEELEQRPQSPAAGARPDMTASEARRSDEPTSFDATQTKLRATRGSTDAVYELSDQGRTIVEIAEALGRSAGEVELILNLRGRAARG